MSCTNTRSMSYSFTIPDTFDRDRIVVPTGWTVGERSWCCATALKQKCEARYVSVICLPTPELAWMTSLVCEN